MRCIICQNEKKESIEHIISEALGNKKLITMRVCEDCNNKLGSNVDNYLTDHPIVKIIRINYKLLGKKNKDIKFFNSIETDINTGQKYSMKNNKPMLQARTISSESGRFKIEAANLKEGMAHIRKILKRQGISEEKINEICKDAICYEETLLSPEFKKDASIDMKKMSLAAIKMAYEYTFEILGEKYLEDDIAKLFRRELYEAVKKNKKDVNPSEELVKYVTFPINSSGVADFLLEQKELLEKTDMEILHMIFFVKQDNILYCVLNLCMLNVISFVVKVSEHENRYRYNNILTLIAKSGEVINF